MICTPWNQLIARAVICCVTFLPLMGCAARIIPPRNPAHPQTVIVTDYGRHSSLILPTESGQLIEFTYGDWNWFALGQTGVYRAFEALFFSHTATLGVRMLPFAEDTTELSKHIGCQRVLEINIDSTNIQSLRTELARQFIQGILTVTYNHNAGCFFIRDAEHYALWHNCNHLTAHWLEQLGCQIQGTPISSSFILRASP